MPGIELCLNGVRPRRPEQSIPGGGVMGGLYVSLNGVRPRRPEQCSAADLVGESTAAVSMESGLEGRNN